MHAFDDGGQYMNDSIHRQSVRVRVAIGGGHLFVTVGTHTLVVVTYSYAGRRTWIHKHITSNMRLRLSVDRGATNLLQLHAVMRFA